MKTTILAVCAATFGGMAMAQAGDPLIGTWQTVADDNGNSGIIEVAPCGQFLCGTLTASYDASGAQFASPNQGRLIISETVNDGDGTYSGKVYSPDRDATYNSDLVLSGDQLSVSGCFFGICRDGGTWVRR